MPEKGNSTQQAAESDVEGFARKLGPFVTAAETTRMAMVFTDARNSEHPIIFANDSFLSLTGYGRDEVLGQSFTFLMSSGADPAALTAIQAAFEGASGDDPEIAYRRKDGAVRWVSVFVSPVRNAEGEVVQYFASFIDLTRHNQEKDRLRLLLDELNHRTQNTLTTVLAIAAQTLRGMADEEVVDLLEGRILALAKTQSLLGRENWDRVGLREVLDQVLDSFRSGEQEGGRFVVDGEDILLGAKTALTLAMVFHELATNATTHGALSNDTGQIEIAWRTVSASEGPSMQLRWQESGGPVVTSRSRKGFGSRLIERDLAQELDGQVRLSYEPAGVVCDIVMPLPWEAADGAS